MCNFHWKSVFGQFFVGPSALITQRCVITPGPIFSKMVLKWAQGLKKKIHEVSARKNNNRLRYNKKCRGGADSAPPALLGLTCEYIFFAKDLQAQMKESKHWYHKIHLKASFSIFPLSPSLNSKHYFIQLSFGFTISYHLYDYLKMKQRKGKNTTAFQWYLGRV